MHPAFSNETDYMYLVCDVITNQTVRLVLHLLLSIIVVIIIITHPLFCYLYFINTCWFMSTSWCMKVNALDMYDDIQQNSTTWHTKAVTLTISNTAVSFTCLSSYSLACASNITIVLFVHLLAVALINVFLVGIFAGQFNCIDICVLVVNDTRFCYDSLWHERIFLSLGRMKCLLTMVTIRPY